MEGLCGTKQAAKLLGVRPGTLASAVWSGRLSEPERSPSGTYLWSEGDLEAASRLLLGKSMRVVQAERELQAAAVK